MLLEHILRRYDRLLDGGFSLTPSHFRDRDEFVLTLGQCLSYWQFEERNSLWLIAALNGTPADPGKARRSHARRKLLVAAGRGAFEDQSLEDQLLARLVSACEFGASLRNDLAHGLWGILTKHPEGVTWTETSCAAEWGAKAWIAGPQAWDPENGFTKLDAGTYVCPIEIVKEFYVCLREIADLIYEFLLLVKDPDLDSKLLRCSGEDRARQMNLLLDGIEAKRTTWNAAH